MSGQSSGARQQDSAAKGNNSYALGVIGTGVMGIALVKGIVGARVVRPGQIIAFDVNERYLADLCTTTGVTAAADNEEVVRCCGMVLLAVKPQVLEAVLLPLKDAWRRDHLLISIAAGVTIKRLQSLTRDSLAVARVMPNLLCTVGEAASGVAFSEQVSQRQQAWVLKLLGAVGTAVRVEEKLMDAVTALAGSGPAFVALVVEALADGAVAAGLPRDQAMTLAAQTVMGTGKYLLQTGEHPGQLKDRVCSPAGTTIEGVRALEEGGLRNALIDAVLRAARRSQELGQS